MSHQNDSDKTLRLRVPGPEPTGRQPVPATSPLDLLAELTNATPPESPLRTVRWRFKTWAPLVVLLTIVVTVVQMVRPLPEPSLALAREPQHTFEGRTLHLPWPGEGQAAVEVEGVGTMGIRGEQTPAPIASVAKTMTAYVILQGHFLKGEEEGPLIEVDQQAEDEAQAKDESTASIRKNQRFTEKQMLQLLMIPSANNVARLLARWDSQSEEAFVQKMNAAARTLDMDDTTYTDPSGLRATTVSTAADQLKLAKAVLQNEVFREIVDTPQIKIRGVPGTIYNNNGRTLLEPGVNGVKTGSSTPAGGNLLWSADTVVDGAKRRIIGAVFGIQTGATVDAKLQRAITHSITLIQAAQESLDSSTVVKKSDVIGYVDDGLGGRSPVVATKDLKAVGWPGLRTKIRITDDGIPHSAPTGTVVGKVSVGTGTGTVSVPVALQDELVEPGLRAKLARMH
ncbi:D-alanyl-D-alanine carboxypeptidase family protein [Streptomyces sp. NPDC052013]|uniref:D-alanyl-D-alanine carboxypeptidase family protein n=1 Tax=Streptomyces sp. NPDC052013 TaxID=3365679 RepID=UPI0037D19096